MSILSRLFSRAPRYDTSAYGSVYAALKASLTREGIKVGGTANYPRIEIHSIIEGERQDKDGRMRQLTCTVESMSNRSLVEAVNLNDANLRLLTENVPQISGWTVVGIVPGQLQDLTETSDPQKILYRLLQELVIFVEQAPAAEPAPTIQQASTTN